YAIKERKIVYGRYNKLDLGDGFLYFKLKQFKDKVYLRCGVNSDICKASYVVPIENDELDIDKMKCIVPHNHPPDETAVEAEKFMLQLRRGVEAMECYPSKKIYNIVAEGYPELAKLYPYKLLSRRIRYWRKLLKENDTVKIDYDSV
ncbi:hypothetical protein NQ317_006894, partial [Molorchus minor]